jgi:glycerate dehydrogenase
MGLPETATESQSLMEHQIVLLESGAVGAVFRKPDIAHQWREYPQTTGAELEARLQGASIAIVNKVRLGADLIGRLPELRMVAIAATGSDNVALEACKDRGRVVSNVRGYATASVPEQVFTLLLALRRRLFEYVAAVRAGRWQTAEHFCFFDFPITDLAGQTLTVVGSGSLGAGVARLAQAFGMRVVHAERRGVDRPREGRVAFEAALAEADVVSLHCPLTPETKHLIGVRELELMNPRAILINTARGGLVDEAALVAALRSGRIAGAGIDVLPQEPPCGGNPLLAAGIPNLLMTPHVAWASQSAMQALADQVIDNIEAFAAGTPRNRLA